MDISYNSGKYVILSSNSIILFNNESDLGITLTMDSQFKFTIHFTFTCTEEKNQIGIKVRADSKTNTIHYECQNFDNILGNGTNTPIELATYDNRKIFINFFVQTISITAPRVLTYTIYIE